MRGGEKKSLLGWLWVWVLVGGESWGWGRKLGLGLGWGRKLGLQKKTACRDCTPRSLSCGLVLWIGSFWRSVLGILEVDGGVRSGTETTDLTTGLPTEVVASKGDLLELGSGEGLRHGKCGSNTSCYFVALHYVGIVCEDVKGGAEKMR